MGVIGLAVFELGVLKNGLLLVKREYYDKLDRSIRVRHPQIIDGISKMASIILKDSVKFMKFDDLMVAVYSSMTPLNGHAESKYQRPSNFTIASYCIGDKAMMHHQIFPLLSRITQSFIRNFRPQLKNTKKIQDFDIYTTFSSEIDKILKDVQYTPIDRLKMGIL